MHLEQAACAKGRAGNQHFGGNEGGWPQGELKTSSISRIAEDEFNYSLQVANTKGSIPSKLSTLKDLKGTFRAFGGS